MYRAAAILATALIVGTVTQTPSAAATGRDTGLVSTDYIIVTATVEAVDQERRLVTIKDPDGKTVPLRASKKVKDFEKEFTELMRAQYKAVLDNFRVGKFEDADVDVVKKVATELATKY